MATSGICCANLKDSKALMKMGLALVLVGHVNFLLGALVHGAVLRHINLYRQRRSVMYGIANVIAIVAGLMGVISGITAIVLSKNKKNRILKWVLLVFSFLAGLLGAAAATGLIVAIVRVIIHRGSILFTNCPNFNQTMPQSSITFECPFDHTRIYGTTQILWLPLILMCIVEMVFSLRSFAACCSFLYLCPCRKEPLQARRVMFQMNQPSSTLEEMEAGAEDEPAEQEELLHGRADEASYL